MTSNSDESSSIRDRDLIARLRQGDPHALSDLYAQYARLVHTLALRMLTNSQEAEDLTQEIFVTLWQRQQYDPNRGSLSSYLVTLTRSRALDRLRSRGSTMRMMQQLKQTPPPPSQDKTPLEFAVLQERSQQVRTALAQLSPEQREILEIAYFEGLSQAQIAQRLNIPLGTVKTRSRQGLLKLRDCLESQRFFPTD